MEKKPLFILTLASLLALAGCTVLSKESSSEGGSSYFSSDVSKGSSEEGEDTASSSVDAASSNVDASEYAIVATSDEGAKVTFANDKAASGTDVHFTVKAIDGFKIESVVVKAGSSELELTIGLDGDYSFVMPKRGVSIAVTSARKSFKVSISDVGGFLKSITQKKVGSNAYASLDTITEESEPDEEGDSLASTYQAAQFGAEILLTFNANVTSYDLTGITINGATTAFKGDETSYSFVMPALDTSIVINRAYKAVDFRFVDSEHISLSLYSDAKGENEIKSSCSPYEEVYLKATSSSEDYAVKTLTCIYYTTNESSTKKDLLSLFDSRTGFYKFTFPSSVKEVSIEVTEYDLHAYKGQSFVGEFMNLDFSYGPEKDYDSFESNCSLKIEESGDIVYKRSASTTYSDYSVASFDEPNKLISLNKSGSYAIPSIAYSSNILVYDAYLKKGVYDSGDLMVSFKKANENASYSVKATQFELSGITYALACFYEGDTLSESVLIERDKSKDYNKNKIHFGVDVEMLEGASVNEKKAIFRVKDGDSAILGVGYTGEGGAANRLALGSEYGTYTDSDNKLLYLNGSGTATYDGASYGYTLGEDGTSITLSSNDCTVTGTIDADAKSFTLISKEAVSMPWKGKTYQGTSQWSSSDTDSGSICQAVFSATENKVTWNEMIGGRAYYSAETTYTVENGNVIKTEFYTCAHTKGSSGVTTITLTYNADGDYFTANGGYSGAYFANTKLSLVS